MPNLVVLSHLRWDFVFQRPQHLMSRFAQTGNVLFIEEPVHKPGDPGYTVSHPCTNVTVIKPHTPLQNPGFEGKQTAVLAPVIEEVVQQMAPEDYCAWFYTPMALPLLDALKPQAVIYDCMDELSAFAYAPPQLKRRERALLKRADLVFTGGPSLYRAKRSHNPATHCFPSAVDTRHFSRGADRANVLPSLAGIAKPRLGFFGVVDERFDCELLATIAAMRPDWQFCIVGPVVKIDPSLLPRRANIHYFGQQPYADLPGFIAGWDVCLLLFAQNDATRFISPTKTLEYMAAARPVVSTPVVDVVDLYGDLVSIARSPEEFVSACEALLAETADERILREAAMRRKVETLTWDNTAKAMAAVIAETVVAKRAQPNIFGSRGVLQAPLATPARTPAQ